MTEGTKMKFHLVTPLFNMAPWIGEGIAMLRRQTYGNFSCVLIDDLSTDGTCEKVREAIAGDARFELVVNSEKFFSLGNMVRGIRHLQPADEDVILLVDGDDALAHEQVLEHLAAIYEESGCWLTYGSYCSSAGERDRICKPYPEQVLRDRSVRNYPFHGSHLKTFKYKLFKRIAPESLSTTAAELRAAARRALLAGKLKRWWHWRGMDHRDLLDPSGGYLRRCMDKALMYPMLEMAGLRSRFVDEIVYRYNTYERELEFGGKAKAQRGSSKWYQRATREILRCKPRYSQLQE